MDRINAADEGGKVRIYGKATPGHGGGLSGVLGRCAGAYGGLWAVGRVVGVGGGVE
ncbi:hypothetical protein OG394_14230 [Kribbella sp. NBC_01245]|uniref:hypothetical protein n=1 Tax=Kribbella sp. NBC_01245 TaxID=2903578 RepID=UPI002E29DE1A|nr:hypothetical protein [Kribbella sp. NBC_01245]